MRVPPCGCEGVEVGHFRGVDGGGGGTMAGLAALEEGRQVAKCGWTDSHRKCFASCDGFFWIGSSSFRSGSPP